jgi:hypothetical protein
MKGTACSLSQTTSKHIRLNNYKLWHEFLGSIACLESKFSPDRLRNHRFEWIRSSSESREDEWLPEYTYWKPPHKNKSASIEEIWKEWMFGMDGQLSVRELMAGWEARWRRNNAAAKSEATRRKKLITLIERLSKKPNWSNELGTSLSQRSISNSIAICSSFEEYTSIYRVPAEA